MKFLSQIATTFLFLGLSGYSYAQDSYDDKPENTLPNDADPGVINDPSRDGPIRAEPKPNTNVQPEEADYGNTIEVGINTSSGSMTVKVRMEETKGVLGRSELRGREMLEPGLEIYSAFVLGGREDEVSCNAIKLVGENGWGQAGTIAGVPFNGAPSGKPHTGIDAIDCSVPTT